MTKIKYSKQVLDSSLKMGIFFCVMGLLIFILGSYFSLKIKEIPLDSNGIGLIGSGIFFLIIHYYKKTKTYLTIENGVLRKNSFLGSKKVNLNEVVQMKKFGGDYILKTDKSEFTIDSQVIDEESLVVLNSELEKLKLEWN